MGYTHVIGIDPSLTSTAIADGGEIRTYGGDSKLGDQRLNIIYTAVNRHLGRVGVTGCLVVMEDLPTHAKGAGITGMVQGVIRLALIDAGVSYVRVVASTLKAYSTGSGSATKPDMRVALLQRTGIDERNEDKVDAWWLRQAGLDAIGHPDAILLPKAQRKRLQVIRWPQGVPLEI